MKRIGTIITSLIILAFEQVCSCQGYNLKISISGLHFANLYLAYYYGSNTYIKDTVRTNADGEAVFSGTDKLPEGIYFLVLPNNNSIEILIGEDQSFEFETSLFDILKNLKIKNAIESEEYLRYQKFIETQELLLIQLKNHREKVYQVADSVKLLNKKIIEVENSIEDYKLNLVNKYPSTILARLMKAFTKIKIPDFKENPAFNKRKNDSLNWVYFYQYNFNHYFDNVDFSCRGLLYSPVINSKIEPYFNKVLPQNADSLIKYIDKLLMQNTFDPEMYKYLLSWLYDRYNNIHQLPDELVYIHIVDNFYLKNQAFWLEQMFIDKLNDHIQKVKCISYGVNISDIIEDTVLDSACLNFPKIVMLMNPSCEKCKSDLQFLETLKSDFYVLLISSDSMQQFIPAGFIDFSTKIRYLSYHQETTGKLFYKVNTIPFYYLLDTKNYILMKNYNLHDILTNYNNNAIL